MINELVEFYYTIPTDYYEEGVLPTPGLNIIIDVDEDGYFIDGSYKSYLMLKPEKTEDEFRDICSYFGKRELYSRLIEKNKCMDSGTNPDDPDSEFGAKQLTSANPFTIIAKMEKFKNGKVMERIPVYYKNLRGLDGINDNDKELLNNLCSEVIDKLNGLLLVDKDFVELQKNEDKKNVAIKIFFKFMIDGEENEEMYRKFHRAYLKEKLFLKDEFSRKDEQSGEKHGVTSFFTVDNIHKAFNRHQTMNIGFNSIYSATVNTALYSLSQIFRAKLPKLPKPLPVFINKQELNDDLIKIFRKKRNEVGNEPITFHELMKELWNNHKDDIGNYYLIYWSKKGGLTFHDVDYVASFEYEMPCIKLKSLFTHGSEEKIDTIFRFEEVIVTKIFNNSLVQYNKDGKVITYKYLDDINYNPKYHTKTIYNNILKYRNAFYDYIYKLKREAITGTMFYSLMLSTILDDIKHDKFENNNHSKNHQIKGKLNIFFSLNSLFDKENKNFGGNDMPSLIPVLRDKMNLLMEDEETHLESNEEFAFAAGYLVNRILGRSKAAEKSHAMIEPFINKTDAERLKATIAISFNQYKHAFGFYEKKIKRLSEEVYGFQCSESIKNLLPHFLAGYFTTLKDEKKENNKEAENVEQV